MLLLIKMPSVSRKPYFNHAPDEWAGIFKFLPASTPGNESEAGYPATEHGTNLFETTT